MLVWQSDNFLDRLNELLNHPGIYPYVKGDMEGRLDASRVDANQILLDSEHGAFWLLEIEPGVWEAHTLFPVGSPNTVRCTRAAIEHVRSLPGYKKIVSYGPRANQRAVKLLRKMGFVYTRTEGSYQGQPLDHYEYH